MTESIKEKIIEKGKPFRLVKYFSFISVVLIFIVTIIMSGTIMHWARNMILKKSEDFALLLTENLNHQIFMQFLIPVAFEFGKIQLRNPAQFERLDKVVRGTIHSFAVDMVHIYDLENTVSYSLDHSMLGKKNIGGDEYLIASNGKSTSKLIRKGNIWQIIFGTPQESKLVTYTPLRAEQPLSQISGPILGVLQLVQDLSEDYHSIARFQILIVATSCIVMGLLFIILRYIVKRGEYIIEKRSQERRQLEEQLSRAERFVSLGKMAAGVSHEIKNPLGIIKSSAQLLKKKIIQSDTDSTLAEVILQEASRLNEIVNDFLQLARPNKPNLAPCRIEDILDKNILNLAPQLEKNKYFIEKSYSDDLPIIQADFNMLYQAFLNILINAMESMPNGGLIKVDATKNSDYVIVTIDDEGEGIPKENMNHIWDPFFTSKEKGTGLGLSIVKNIIEGHNGMISIENAKEKGVHVHISIPIRE